MKQCEHSTVPILEQVETLYFCEPDNAVVPHEIYAQKSDPLETKGGESSTLIN